jgi:hypothetical protein
MGSAAILPDLAPTSDATVRRLLGQLAIELRVAVAGVEECEVIVGQVLGGALNAEDTTKLQWLDAFCQRVVEVAAVLERVATTEAADGDIGPMVDPILLTDMRLRLLGQPAGAAESAGEPDIW